jgi:hypothetical protein
MDEWTALIDRSPLLSRPAPREIVNPFTGVRELTGPRAGEAEILSPNGPVGAIEPSSEFDDDGELFVYAADGKHDVVRSAAQEIAAALCANLEWFG